MQYIMLLQPYITEIGNVCMNNKDHLCLYYIIGYHSDDSENSLVDSLPLDKCSRPVWKYQDIDSFISMTTLPPPPETTVDPMPGRVVEANEDFSNLIIPPPPIASSSSSATQPDFAFPRNVETLKSPTESKISPKIALLQSQLKKTNISTEQNNTGGTSASVNGHK